jgi:hypothetical protein
MLATDRAKAPGENDPSVSGFKHKTAQLDRIKKIASGTTNKQETATFAQAIRKAASQKKQAEDALNPSKISAGPKEEGKYGPPGAKDSSEPGPPAQDKEKVPAGHDQSRSMTRADAKATPKREMGAILDEKMMSSSNDKVLDNVLEHDGDKKYSSARDLTKVAAARALLSRLAGNSSNQGRVA